MQKFPSTGHLTKPGIEPGSPAVQVDSLPSEPPEKLYTMIKIFSHFCVLSWILQQGLHELLTNELTS